MFCPHCGAQNEGNGGFCAACGKPLTAAQPAGPAAPAAAPVQPTMPAQSETPAQAPVYGTPAQAPMPAAPAPTASIYGAPAQPEDPAQTPVYGTPAPAANPMFGAPAPAYGAPEVPAAPAPGKKSKKPLAIGIAALAVVLVVVLVLTLLLSGGGSGAMRKHSLFTFTNSEGTYVSFDGKKAVKLLDTVDAGTVQPNIQQTAILYGDTDGAIYYMASNGKAVKVSNDATWLYGSDDDKVLLYKNSDDAYYSVAAGATGGKQIVANADQMEMSGNGKHFAWTVDDGLYIDKTKMANLDATNISIECLSNSGKLVYYYSADKDAFYVKNGTRDPVKLTNGDLSQDDTMFFNADSSQVLYVKDDGYTYLSTNGGDPVKILGKAVSQIATSNWQLQYVSSFKNALIVTTDYGLYRLNGTKDPNKLASNLSGLAVSQDGRTGVVGHDSKLYYVTNLNASINFDTPIGGTGTTISTFRYGANMKEFYFLDSDDNLCYAAGNGKSKTVASDVTSIASGPL
ncbi:MAG: zinc ribbon domain-containing protein, partial [Oscillospiraceae bacterium]|nr:zinc ribbon domain-containing protein [Oscillospiraceae bacterium]